MTTIAPIRLAIDTLAAPARAWAVITEPNLVRQWFADVTPIGDVGTQYRIDFGGEVVDGQVLIVAPGRRFDHEWAWLGDEPRRPTRVSWQVLPLPDGGTRIELLHDGWAEAGEDDAIRDDHEAYWSGYLDDLRDLLEESVDQDAG